MTINIGNVLSRPYELKTPLCDCCERRSATKRVWLRDEDISVPHPMFHNLCNSCLTGVEIDELFWHKLEICDGFMEDIPPRLSAYITRPKTWEELDQLVGLWKEVPTGKTP